MGILKKENVLSTESAIMSIVNSKEIEGMLAYCKDFKPKSDSKYITFDSKNDFKNSLYIYLRENPKAVREFTLTQSQRGVSLIKGVKVLMNGFSNNEKLPSGIHIKSASTLRSINSDGDSFDLVDYCARNFIDKRGITSDCPWDSISEALKLGDGKEENPTLNEYLTLIGGMLIDGNGKSILSGIQKRSFIRRIERRIDLNSFVSQKSKGKHRKLISTKVIDLRCNPFFS